VVLKRQEGNVSCCQDWKRRMRLYTYTMLMLMSGNFNIGFLTLKKKNAFSLFLTLNVGSRSL